MARYVMMVAWIAWLSATMVAAAMDAETAPSATDAAAGQPTPTPTPPAADGIPPLTERQRLQLASANDGSGQLDEGALYALLEHVMRWPRGEEADTLNPNYGRIMQEPQHNRGQAFLLEGQVVAPPQRMQLIRAGSWGTELVYSVLLVQRDPDVSVVVLYLDPDAALQPPRLREHVRIPAAFYKIWGSTTHPDTGQVVPMDYLVFVSPGPSRMEEAAAAGPDLTWVVFLLLVLVGLYYMVRRFKTAMVPSGPYDNRRHAYADEQAQDSRLARRLARKQLAARMAEPDTEEDAQDLPEDPVEALAELERRHQQQET